MKHREVKPWSSVTVSPSVAARVAAAAKRVGLTREQALAIAEAEPRGATVFAGRLAPEEETGARKPGRHGKNNARKVPTET